MKRFYKLVSHTPTAGGYEVHLDSKPVKSPAKRTLVCVTEPLALSIVREWADQGEHIDPETMPLTQILTTQIDVVSEQREDMTAEVLRFLDTDLICYRTDEPQAMAKAQAAVWDKWVEWMNAHTGATLQTTTGLAALKQDQIIHEKLAADVKAMDEADFTIYQMLVPLTGSAILPLAFVKGQATPEDLYEAANVEENEPAEIYNEDFYGTAPHQEQKQNAMRRDLKAAREFLDFLKS